MFTLKVNIIHDRFLQMLLFPFANVAGRLARITGLFTGRLEVYLLNAGFLLCKS